jgi:hypothetical protein
MAMTIHRSEYMTLLQLITQTPFNDAKSFVPGFAGRFRYRRLLRAITHP